MNIVQALRDPNLLGAALGPAESWQSWFTILRAAEGLKLNDEEQNVFATVAGGRQPPTRAVTELWCQAGRRSGKSRMAAACAVVAAFRGHDLAPGERGFVLCLSPSKPQAALVKNYCEAFIQESAVLRQAVVNITSEEIVLANGITIAIHTSSFRSIRGRTICACVLDEIAFWRDETSAVPDVECYRALRPALDASKGLLVAISSPYRSVGLLATKYRESYGQNSADVLFIKAPTLTLNPTFDERAIAKAYVADAESAKSEYGAEARSDLASLLADDVIDASIDHGRPLELPPQSGIYYRAFVDSSAGRHDAFTCAIGHVVEGEDESKVFVCDVLRACEPPFHPNQVAAEFATLAGQYRVGEVHGDAFAGLWTEQAFRDAGIGYRKSDLPKSQLYLESLSTFNTGRVRLPNDAKLIRELRMLERQTHRSGKDSVDHPANGSDDRANVVVGCMWVCKVAGRKRRGDSMTGFLEHTGRITWLGENRGRVSALSASQSGCKPGKGV